MKKDIKDLSGKKLIVFDLDGTLAESKSKMDREMAALMAKLLAKNKVAVIGGGKYELFKSQLLGSLKCPKELLQNLFLFPTTSTSFYRYAKGSWKKVYRLELTQKERASIKKAFQEAFKEIGYVHPKTYGPVIEDRKTQVTFSALGQEIVAVLGEKEGVRLKNKWKQENTKTKLKIARLVQRRLPRLEVRSAGFTSIDVTRKGIDKAYGLRQIQKHLHIPIRDMVFIGDALFPGGNDYAVRRTRVDWMSVRGPQDTKKIIRKILAA